MKKFMDRQTDIFQMGMYIKIVYGGMYGQTPDSLPVGFCLFVLRFYGPVNLMGSCQVQSVYLTTCLLGRLSPLSG